MSYGEKPDTTSCILSGYQGPRKVLPHHLEHLRLSGLNDDTIVAAGIYSETNKDKLASLMGRKYARKNWPPAIVFPYIGANGENGYYRIRPDKPAFDRNGKPIKYESPIGEPNRIYLPPGVSEFLSDAKSCELLITEGEKKALAASQEGFPCIGLIGVFGWKRKDEERLLAELEQIDWRGREVRIVFDSDIGQKANVQNAESRLAKLLTDRGAIVKVVRLPDGPLDSEGKPTKIGLDDYLVQFDKAGLRKLLDAAEDPEPVDPESIKEDASKADPADEAEIFLKNTERDGVYRLRFWRGAFYFWNGSRYTELQTSEVRSLAVRHLNEAYSRVTTSTTNNVLDQIKALSLLPSRCSPPSWIEQSDAGEWRSEDFIVARNGIVHLPSIIAGQPAIVPATPRLFSMTSLDYEYQPEAPEPGAWLSFLNELWPYCAESIATLQEWFGYCLVADTRQQKILGLFGPRRSGKGTIARVLTSVVGHDNVAGPTLSGLGTQFGLWPLVDKLLAIIADARLSGRTDQAIVVERLLSISGEDALTVDRKCIEPIKSIKLNTRLMLISNELPRLGDSSNALSGRMIVLKLEKSFYGLEDTFLTDRLLQERPAILNWAIEGWRRLRERGRFIQPQSSAEMVEQMEDLASPIGAFVRDCCLVGPAFRVSVDQLFEAWKNWCAGKNREPGTEQVFGRDLAAAVPSARRIRPNDGGVRWRGYEGIGLRV